MLKSALSFLPVRLCGGRKQESKIWILDIRLAANSGMTSINL